MKNFLVQIKVYGYTTIQAESWEDAINDSEEMTTAEFDLSGDADIDVLDEVDDTGCPVEGD